MPVARYRKRPVVVDAIQWHPHENCAEVAEFLGDAFDPEDCSDPLTETYKIDTLEGPMWASAGDWIIRGVEGEHYPCKPSIFAATYEPEET